MQQAKRALAIVAFTLVSCSSPVIPANTPALPVTTLRLYTTTAAIPLLQDLTSSYALTHPNITFETLAGNYQSMIERVMRLEMPYFLTNHLPVDSPLLGYPVGQDGIAIIVHPDNPVRALSSEQVRQIFDGTLTNWREVGGAEMAIEVVSRENGSGTRAEFENQLLGERRVTLNARVAPTSAAVVATVAALPTAIGYVSISYVDERVQALALDNIAPTQENVGNNTYPLRSIIYIVGVQEPVTDFRAFIAWIQSPQGQAVVTRRYAPLLPTP
ncbi:MAG: substrate-binding domain-containing protein [Chloroflexi bacterium]|nr:substrate-binding domain-containing protein [Chloroflexota bacterium]